MYLRLTIFIFLFFLATGKGVGANELALDFDRMDAHIAPVGFTQARTGRGGTGAWEIKEDNTAPSGKKVLAQTSSDPTNYRFPLCIYDAFEARDVDLSVSFKPLSGRVDQAAGLVWRYRDPDNYYVVRANALEDNVVLYKVENGERSDLKIRGGGFLSYGKEAPVPARHSEVGIPEVSPGSRSPAPCRASPDSRRGRS